jgi:hypothetical protein
MRKKQKIQFVLVMIALAEILSIGQAYGVEEPFDYDVGNRLIDSGDASGGWDGPWELFWGGTEGTEFSAAIAEGSLDVGGVSISGNHLQCKNYTYSDGTGIGRYFADPYPDTSGAEYWCSFVMQKENSSNTESWSGISIGGNVWVGKPFDADYYGADAWGEWGVSQSDVPVTTRAWIVVKMEMSGDSNPETLYLWVNPDPSIDPNEVPPDVSTLFDGNGGFSDVMVDFGGPSGGSGNCTFDEIRWGTSWPDVRGFGDAQAYNPVPASEQILVAPDIALSWDAPIAVTDPVYNVYVDPNRLVVESRTGTTYSSIGQPETTFDPTGDLDLGTTYYWIVDVTNGDAGNVWNFTTYPATPVFTVNPVSQSVPAGSEVTLTVVVVSPDPDATDYQWYKAATDVPVDVGTPIEGETETTLTIEDFQLDNEGFYYCLASNDEGSTQSQRAQVLTQRLMAHWKFEDNLNDETGTYPAESVSPSFAAGIDGQAILITENSNEEVAAYGIGKLGNMTISMWLQPTYLSFGNVHMLSTVGDELTEGIIDMRLNDFAWFYCEINSVGTVSGPIPDPTAGAWYHVAYTYDTNENLMKLYVNGEPAGSVDIFADLPADLNILNFGRNPLAISDDDLNWIGPIDDVQIYSYALDAFEIAGLYTDFVTGVEICPENPPYDLNDDCIVDINDIALLTGDWLLCNIVPACLEP